jgi:putative CocE/NonD family hydrolase
VQAAVLNLSGWYDDAYGPEGAVTNFTGLAASRSGETRIRSRLVLGPWVHGVSATAETASGERRFGRAAAIAYDALILGWMDRHVRGLDNGVDREAPVRVFVMGENAWRESDRWPLAGLREDALYLAPGQATQRGVLRWSTAASEAGTSAFVSDPARPVTDPFAARGGAQDYRELAQRGDVLTFETAPLDKPVTVVGALTAEIFLSTDAPDVDLWVKVFDVAPDGTAFNLMNPGLDVLRASYRNGGPTRELLSPDQVYPLRFEQLFTGNSFLKGHRIRLCLMAAFMPHFSRNLQTGELEMDSSAMRKARLTVHHGGRYASRLVLPVLAP